MLLLLTRKLGQKLKERVKHTGGQINTNLKKRMNLKDTFVD